MVTTVLDSQDVHQSGTDARHPRIRPIDIVPDTHNGQLSSKYGFDSGIAFVEPPTSISPPLGVQIPSASHDHGENHHVGPSQSVSRVIPPPPKSRRHRSGVLMSRVRATSDFINVKSRGDLASIVDVDRNADSPEYDTEEQAEEDPEDVQFDGRRSRMPSREAWKRVVSEGSKQGGEDDEDTFWDNSARYYHHLHSRPPSRSGSQSTSPDQSPIASHATSPIFVRRSISLSQNGPGPPVPISKSLSPNQHFLQSHLPPTFPSSSSSGGVGASPDSLFPDHHLPSTMVFTPTTQEWNELQAIPEWKSINGGKDEPSFSGSSDEEDHSGRHHRPVLRSVISAEYLGPEPQHTPDPGSPPTGRRPAELERSATQPTFLHKIINPSPIILPEERRGSVASSLGEHVTPRRKRSGILGLDTASAEISVPHIETPVPQIETPEEYAGDDDVILNPERHSPPVRWNSIGRSDSLRAVHKHDAPALPRTKTKRELEREKLLNMVDEESESDHDTGKVGGWGGGVQEIGKGLGLKQVKSHSAPVTPVTTNAPRMESGPDMPSAGSNRTGTEKKQPNMSDVRVDPHSFGIDPVVNGGVNKETMNPFETTFAKKGLLGSKDTTPAKPSPLNSTPLVPVNGLSTPSTATVTPNETPMEHPVPVVSSSPLDTIRNYTRSLQQHDRPPPSREATPPMSPAPSQGGRRRDMNRVSLVAGRVVQPYNIPPSTSLPPSSTYQQPDSPALQSFSPFRSPPPTTASGGPGDLSLPYPSIGRLDSTISIAPSTGVPSECGTPTEEKAGGLGGRGIADYVILKEAGKGAYGLVMRAKVKGISGEPVGDEVIIKYIIKARILADCWKKHKSLGPIPVEIHVMDQLRHLVYTPPKLMSPWDPARARPGEPNSDRISPLLQSSSVEPPAGQSTSPPSTHTSTLDYIAKEIKTSPQRGHPNICKLLDFFEDREFYYLVMPRFGTGQDLFDRVESSPSGLKSFEIRSLVGQLVDAVRFLHSNGIVHRDIKDENVILDGSGHCQLIDFGSAAHWRPGKKWDTFSGTLHYASPEILRGEMYGGKEQDVWALGVVTYVLLVGETPFSDLPDEVLQGLVEGTSADAALAARCSQGQQGEEEDGGGRLSDAADLVKSCMELNVADRPAAEYLLEHRYLKGRNGWAGKRGWMGSEEKK